MGQSLLDPVFFARVGPHSGDNGISACEQLTGAPGVRCAEVTCPADLTGTVHPFNSSAARATSTSCSSASQISRPNALFGVTSTRSGVAVAGPLASRSSSAAACPTILSADDPASPTPRSGQSDGHKASVNNAHPPRARPISQICTPLDAGPDVPGQPASCLLPAPRRRARGPGAQRRRPAGGPRADPTRLEIKWVA